MCPCPVTGIKFDGGFCLSVRVVGVDESVIPQDHQPALRKSCKQKSKPAIIYMRGPVLLVVGLAKLVLAQGCTADATRVLQCIRQFTAAEWSGCTWDGRYECYCDNDDGVNNNT